MNMEQRMVADGREFVRRPRFDIGASRRLGVGDLLGILMRRKVQILIVLIATALAGYAYVSQMKPLYWASARVLLNDREATITDIQSVMAGLPVGSDTVQSEIQVIRSRTLAERVLDQLQLDRNPVFNPTLLPPEPPSWFSVAGLRRLLSGGDQDEDIAGTIPPEVLRPLLVNKLLISLDVAQVGRSRAIDIAFTSPDPALATAVANTVANLYISSQIEAKLQATSEANAWLDAQVAELRQSVAAADQQVEAYRTDSDLLQGGNDTTLASQQVAEISRELIAAESQQAEITARLGEVERVLNSSASIDSSSEVLRSPLIQSLRQQAAQLSGEVAELEQQYGDRHPRITSLRAQRAEVQGSINTEVGRILESLRQDANAADSRVSILRASLEEAKSRVSDVNEADIGLRALTREADANRSLLETFLSRGKEVSAQESFQTPDSTLLSAATTPLAPFQPSPILYAVVLLCAVFLSITVAFVLELFDRGFRSMSQLEDATGWPAYGLLPRLTMLLGFGRIGRRRVPQQILRYPTSAYAEAARGLYTSLLLANGAKPARTVLVTSSVPMEGKTSTSIALALTAARAGRRVVLVDCDLRRPTAHQALRLHRGPGLVEYFTGAKALDEIVQTHAPSGMQFIGAGRVDLHSSSLLASDRMERLLADLAERHDLVIVDTAPVLALSETRLVAHLVDSVVFCVRWASTRRERALGAMRQIVENNDASFGTLLTMVDVKHHAKYSFPDSGLYTGAVRKYYAR